MIDYLNEDNYYDAAQALHWYCVNFHGGQFSNLYLIQCKLGYNPGILECGCENDEGALMFYQALEYGEIQPFELLEKIQDVLRSLD